MLTKNKNYTNYTTYTNGLGNINKAICCSESGDTTVVVADNHDKKAIAECIRRMTRDIRSRRWVLTLNNYTEEDFYTIYTHYTRVSTFWILAKEVGEKKGVPHLQCYMEFKNAVAKSHLIRTYGWTAALDMAKGSRQENVTYCSKDFTHVQVNTVEELKVKEKNHYMCNFDVSSFEREFNMKKNSRPLQIIEKLHAWQQTIVDEIDAGQPDDRTINWIYDTKGGVGKTALIRYLISKRGALVVSGKAADIKFAITTFVTTHPGVYDIPPVIWTIPRAQQNHISYSALEEIKDGVFFSGKYESGQVIFNSPHLYCFSNSPPEVEKMTTKRWNVRKFNKEGNLVRLSAERLEWGEEMEV